VGVELSNRIGKTLFYLFELYRKQGKSLGQVVVQFSGNTTAFSLFSDFLDNSLEWRRLFPEIWGTFLLVLVAAGGGVVGAFSRGRVSLGMAVVAPGIMVMAIIYFMGPVSEAHLNPAVTLAFTVRRNFPWNRVPGGICAAAFLRMMFGTIEHSAQRLRESE